MAARVCARDTCQIRYPTEQEYMSCPACGYGTTWAGMENPDKDWPDKAAQAIRRIETQARIQQIRKEIPLTTEELRVYARDGKFWVKQESLRRAGINVPSLGPSFQLFIANGCVWETQGWHERLRRWWVEKVLCLEDVDDG